VRYGAALAALARHDVDVIAHPTPPSRNNIYKNANVLINARAVGAVGVLSRLPPYDTLPAPAPALLADNQPQAWYDAFARLARDPRLCEEIAERADRYCQSEFSGRANAAAVEQILAAHAAPDTLTRTRRAVIAGPALALDRALVRAKAAVR
jgi:hypothetical protein